MSINDMRKSLDVLNEMWSGMRGMEEEGFADSDISDMQNMLASGDSVEDVAEFYGVTPLEIQQVLDGCSDLDESSYVPENEYEAAMDEVDYLVSRAAQKFIKSKAWEDWDGDPSDTDFLEASNDWLQDEIYHDLSRWLNDSLIDWQDDVFPLWKGEMSQISEIEEGKWMDAASGAMTGASIGRIAGPYGAAAGGAIGGALGYMNGDDDEDDDDVIDMDDIDEGMLDGLEGDDGEVDLMSVNHDEHDHGDKELANERELSQSELDKREEIAQAIEREDPGMPMSKKMAIATAQAKKVAEDEDSGENIDINGIIDQALSRLGDVLTGEEGPEEMNEETYTLIFDALYDAGLSDHEAGNIASQKANEMYPINEENDMKSEDLELNENNHPADCTCPFCDTSDKDEVDEAIDRYDRTYGDGDGDNYTLDMFHGRGGADENEIGPMNGRELLAKMQELWNGKTGLKSSNIVDGHYGHGIKGVWNDGYSSAGGRSGRGMGGFYPIAGSKSNWFLKRRPDGRWQISSEGEGKTYAPSVHEDVVNEAEWKLTSLSKEEAIAKFGKDNVRVEKKMTRSGKEIEGKGAVEVRDTINEGEISHEQAHAAYVDAFMDLGFPEDLAQEGANAMVNDEYFSEDLIMFASQKFVDEIPYNIQTGDNGTVEEWLFDKVDNIVDFNNISEGSEELNRLIKLAGQNEISEEEVEEIEEDNVVEAGNAAATRMRDLLNAMNENTNKGEG